MTSHRFDLFIDSRFHTLYREHPLVLADVGARGGLKSNWAAARPYLRVIGFEPDPREYRRLTEGGSDRSTTWFGVALHNRMGPLRLHIARDRGLTSMFEPDRSFLDAFPQADRFDTIEVQETEGDTLDNLLRSRQIADVDFVKVDTQGSELFVLEGAANTLEASVLGVEVEVEFTPIYRDQPLFADVDAFLRARGFQLFDLRPCYWKRAVGRAVGGPHGQIIWADALYLRTIPGINEAIARLDAESGRAKLLRALSIAMLYGYFDYALDLLRASGAVLTTDDRALIDQRIRRSGGGPARAFPGRRQIAAVLHRLWKLVRPRDDSWSISRADLGNPR